MVNVGKYTSSMNSMGNIPLGLQITIVSFFFEGDVFHMIYKGIFDMYTNLLKHRLQFLLPFPRSTQAKFRLVFFPKELVNLLAIGQLDSLEVGDIKPHFVG